MAITRYQDPVFRHRDGALVAPLAVGCLILAACSTGDGDRAKKPVETPVAEARAAASGREPEAEPPRESNARTQDGYKRDAARRIYFKNPSLLYDGAPPPTLKSIVVLSIRIDATGKPTRVTLVRSNGFRELEQRAIRSVEGAGLLPIPHPSLLKIGSMEYYETWLFRDDERFQIRSLADVQQVLPEAE